MCRFITSGPIYYVPLWSCTSVRPFHIETPSPGIWRSVQNGYFTGWSLTGAHKEKMLDQKTHSHRQDRLGVFCSVYATPSTRLCYRSMIQPNLLLKLCMMGLSHVARTLGQLMQQQSDPCQGQKARNGSVFWMRKMTRHCGKPWIGKESSKWPPAAFQLMKNSKHIWRPFFTQLTAHPLNWTLMFYAHMFLFLMISFKWRK